MDTLTKLSLAYSAELQAPGMLDLDHDLNGEVNELLAKMRISLCKTNDGQAEYDRLYKTYMDYLNCRVTKFVKLYGRFPTSVDI